MSVLLFMVFYVFDMIAFVHCCCQTEEFYGSQLGILDQPFPRLIRAINVDC